MDPPGSERPVCGCDPDRTLNYVYLGPGEGHEHQNSVLRAQRRYYLSPYKHENLSNIHMYRRTNEKEPDFCLKSMLEPHYQVWVSLGLLFEESSILKEAIVLRQRSRRVSLSFVSFELLSRTWNFHY